MLLLTDVVLPEQGGCEVADTVLKVVPSIRVLFLSGYTDDVVIWHGVQHGALAFVPKPFTPAILCDKVSEILRRPSG